MTNTLWDDTPPVVKVPVLRESDAMRYRWTHLPTGKTGIREKDFDKAYLEGHYHLTGHFTVLHLYQSLIDYWNHDPNWHYELLTPAPSLLRMRTTLV